MSSTLPPGLPIVSPYISLVVSRSAWRQASMLSGSTKVSSRPSLRDRCFSCVTDPPYSAPEATMWSPGSSIVKNAAAFQTGDPLLEGRHRRVHDARVRVAVFLEVEVRRRGLGVLENVARRLENRHSASARVDRKSV